LLVVLCKMVLLNRAGFLFFRVEYPLDTRRNPLASSCNFQCFKHRPITCAYIINMPRYTMRLGAIGEYAPYAHPSCCRVRLWSHAKSWLLKSLSRDLPADKSNTTEKNYLVFDGQLMHFECCMVLE
jgi:hypothetical protein